MTNTDPNVLACAVCFEPATECQCQPVYVFRDLSFALVQGYAPKDHAGKGKWKRLLVPMTVDLFNKPEIDNWLEQNNPFLYDQ